jgi:hypothetical protein
MKKWMLGVLVGFIVLSAHAGFSKDWSGYHTMRCDFNYLYNWTAYKMKIDIDPDKHVPVLAFITGKELDKFVKERYGSRSRYSTTDRTATIHISYYGVFMPETNVIYVNSDEKNIELAIVHEIVHSIQFSYKGFSNNNGGLELEAVTISFLFRKEHRIKWW